AGVKGGRTRLRVPHSDGHRIRSRPLNLTALQAGIAAHPMRLIEHLRPVASDLKPRSPKLHAAPSSRQHQARSLPPAFAVAKQLTATPQNRCCGKGHARTLFLAWSH